MRYKADVLAHNAKYLLTMSSRMFFSKGLQVRNLLQVFDPLVSKWVETLTFSEEKFYMEIENDNLMVTEDYIVYDLTSAVIKRTHRIKPGTSKLMVIPSPGGKVPHKSVLTRL